VELFQKDISALAGPQFRAKDASPTTVEVGEEASFCSTFLAERSRKSAKQHNMLSETYRANPAERVSKHDRRGPALSGSNARLTGRTPAVRNLPARPPWPRSIRNN